MFTILFPLMMEHGDYAVGGGDLNDTLGSTPIGFLDASAAIHNMHYDVSANQRWTYIFNGESETLDYAYITDNLYTSMWNLDYDNVHVSADFPSNEHASDHDPVRIRFTKGTVTAVEMGQSSATVSAVSIVLLMGAVLMVITIVSVMRRRSLV